MSTKTSARSRLLSARASLDTARENCPHWDFETDGDPAAHQCCEAVAIAQHELWQARAAYREIAEQALS